MAGGVVANGVYYPTESGLNAPGGFIDRLTQAMDNRAQFNGTLAGLAPTLQAQGIPVAAPQGILGSMLGLLGLGGSQNQPTTPPPMPVARASQGSVSAGGASAPTSTSLTTTDAGAGGPTGMMGMFKNAIAGIESGGKYDAIGPQTNGGDQALGKYQIMASNVPSWTKEVLGQEMTPQQFLASPQAQDAVFQGKFGQYLQKTGNPQDAASMWFTGRPLAQAANAADQLGTTGAGYVRKFMAALPGPVRDRAPCLRRLRPTRQAALPATTRCRRPPPPGRSPRRPRHLRARTRQAPLARNRRRRRPRLARSSHLSCRTRRRVRSAGSFGRQHSNRAAAQACRAR